MGWVKLFPGNKKICEPYSWSGTELDGMSGVELVHANKKLAIYGSGSYWQSDSFSVEIQTSGRSEPKLTHRRIERYLNTFSICQIIDHGPFGLLLDFRLPEDHDVTNWCVFDKDLPQWLIVEMDLFQNKTHFYLSPNKI